MINNTLNFTIGAIVGAGIAWGHWGLTPISLFIGFWIGGCVLETSCRILNYFLKKLLTNK